MDDRNKDPPAKSAPPDRSLEDWLRLWHGQSEDYAVVFLAPDARVVSANEAVTRILGYQPSELVGDTLQRIFSEEDLARGLDAHELEVASKLGRSEDDRWHVGKNGRKVWISGVLMAVRDPQGRQIGFAKVLRDRTDMRTELASLENQLEEAKASAARKVEFLATLGHELRNPLHTLATAYQMLARQARLPPDDPTSAVVQRQLAVFVRILDDLRDVDARRYRQPAPRARSARPAGGDPRRRRAAPPGGAGARAGAAHDPAGPADRRARRLGPHRADRAQPARQRHQVHPRRRRDLGDGDDRGRRWPCCGCEDDGMGLSAEVLPRIFDLFTREERAIESAADGLGIGLALVKSLVALHGGIVQVQSAGPGQGSEFTVRLPLAEPPSEPPA